MKRLALLSGLVAVAVAGPAFAQSAEGDVALAPPEGGEAGVTLVPPPGQLSLHVAIEASLAESAAFKPFSIAPDLWYGVVDRLGVGLVHSSRGSTGFYSGYGDSLCLSGQDNGCTGVYDNVGLGARYQLSGSEGMSVAVDGGLFAGPFDPFALSLKLGVVGLANLGPVQLEVAPSIFAGLTARDEAANSERFFLPVTAMYRLMPELGLALQTGVATPFQGAGDNYAIPVSVGAQYFVTEAIALDAAFSFPAIVGGDESFTGASNRALMLGVHYAL